ncbi:hypothetical protein C0966_04290 [Bacillus methanolicus]|nr:hypothetical protein [Bacillus methanolicus]
MIEELAKLLFLFLFHTNKWAKEEFNTQEGCFHIVPQVTFLKEMKKNEMEEKLWIMGCRLKYFFVSSSIAFV